MYVSDSYYNVLISLDNMGVLKRDRENETMGINTLGNEYKIVLERKDKSLFNEESISSYKCIMRFYNIFGTEVVTLLGSEIDMSKFSDIIYFFLESREPTAVFALNSYEGLCYITLNKEYTNDYKELYNMIISKPIGNDKQVPIATLKFDDETMSRFIDLIYFIFLIDIDNNGEMAKVYRYIDHDMWIADNNSIPPKVSDLLNNNNN